MTSSLPLVYIDQNIISLQLEGKIDLSRVNEKAQLVYSTEHFAEIKRSNNPIPFLQTLDRLSARLLELEIKQWSLTGNAVLLAEAPAEEHYNRYLEAINNTGWDDSLFHPFLSWVCGGDTEALLRHMPEKFFNQLERLIENLPIPTRPDIAENTRSESTSILDSNPKCITA